MAPVLPKRWLVFIFSLLPFQLICKNIPHWLPRLGHSCMKMLSSSDVMPSSAEYDPRDATGQDTGSQPQGGWVTLWEPLSSAGSCFVIVEIPRVSCDPAALQMRPWVEATALRACTELLPNPEFRVLLFTTWLFTGLTMGGIYPSLPEPQNIPILSTCIHSL